MTRRAPARGPSRAPSLFDAAPGAPAGGAYAPPAAPGASTAAAAAFDPLGPLPAGTVLLEASAGTGKTHSIATLVLRLVAEEGLRIDEVLVVTFTEAATTELRDRVRRRLRDALAVAERALAAGAAPAVPEHGDRVAHALAARAWARGEAAVAADRLRRALERFDDAAIATIHGFCARVLRERAFECGAELDGELLPDAGGLLDEVAHDFWARETAARPLPLVRALVERAGLDFAALRHLAGRAVGHADAPCEPPCPGPGAAEEAVAERARCARAVADAWRDEGGHAAFEALDAALAAGALNRTMWKDGALAERVREVNEWAAADPEHEPAPKALAYFGTADLRRATKKGHATPEHPLFDAADALADADRALVDAAAEEALRLRHACVAWARAEVARRKRLRRQHGYDDLLRLVRDALRGAGGDALAAALRGSFRAALIDEFQDTDGVQWEIFARAFGGGAHRLVLIGDPKQAIYGFRGADVGAYLAAREGAAATWALDRNWRTDRALVDALEALVGAHERPFADGGIAWRAVAAHHDAPRLTGGGAPLRVRFLAREGALAPTGKAPTITKGALGALLPDAVAADVVRFLRSGAVLADDGAPAPRPVRPSDVAVLVRSNRQAREIQAALRRAGVPAVVHGAESVFASREAQELAAVLAAALEPANARLLRAALATDLLGLAAAAELPDGAGLGPGDALARLQHAAGRDGEAWEGWSDRLRAWRAAWRGEGRGAAPGGARGEASVMRLVRALLDELRLPERLLALDDGERRLTNLLHVAELLHAAAVRDALEPGATLAWLRGQIACGAAPGDDAARQMRLESDADAAQVVTVHSSKGLEYAAVWCPYLWDGALARDDDKRHPCVHVEGPAGRVRTLHLAARKGDPCLSALDEEAFAESLRLAYVALTRARHRLTLWWGAVNGGETSPLAWLLHGGACDGPRGALDRCAALQGLTDEQLRARLDALAERARGGIAVEVERCADAGRWADPAAAAPALRARPYGRAAPLDDGWRLGSFTALTAGAAARAAAPVDDDAELPEALADAPASDVPPDAPPEAADAVPLAAFPASAAAGIFFHEVLERHDFAAPALLRPRVDAALDAYGFGAAAWGAPVSGALQAVLDAPLAVDARLVPGAEPRPLRLAGLARADRLTELRFELPAAGGREPRGAPVTPDALADALARHPGGALGGPALDAYAARVRALGFRPLAGFLAGAVDLVARHDGRWWLVDWKSNHLGPRRADYAPPRLADAMADGHYVLQYHLYALALHRWLRWRVPGYDWDRDVGGVLYVFLRGVGDGTGVFFDRPPRSRIEALDALFAGRAAGAGDREEAG